MNGVLIFNKQPLFKCNVEISRQNIPISWVSRPRGDYSEQINKNSQRQGADEKSQTKFEAFPMTHYWFLH